MDDPRTAARDAAYAFLSDPNKAEEMNNPMVVFGLIAMVFPDIKIDWNCAGMVVEAIGKMRDDKLGEVLG